MSYGDNQSYKPKKGAIAWMAEHPVAANLLMFVLFVGGLMGMLGTKQEVFPEFDLDAVTVTVPYPGASPTEVEQGILLAIEEAVRGLEGVKRVNAVAYEGTGMVTAELLLGADGNQVLADVKNEVDRIETFPEEAEEPTISLVDNKRQVVSLIIAGDQDLRTLHEIAERARNDLIATGEVTQVELEGVPPLEVAIEVPRETLRKYGLTLPEIANQVALASLELPGGGIETKGGEILVRVAERRRAGYEFENIVLRSTAAGGVIRLGDIAQIRDGYEDTDQFSYYNGKPAVRLTAYRVGDETPIGVSDAVHAFADDLRQRLPENLEVAIWNDDSEMLRARLDLLFRNAMMGLVLVVAILALLLDLRLAFWVSLGIPISFLGAFLVLGTTDFSVNMITLFAFIVTLGMVVDDAIVVGEHIFTKMSEGKGRLQASIEATREMAAPVTFSVLTTVAAFAPLFFLPGFMGKVFSAIPGVVISVLLISLVESFFILPAHLAHESALYGWAASKVRPVVAPLAPVGRGIRRAHASVGVGLERFTECLYRPFVRKLTVWRYLTFAVAVSVLAVTVGYVASGRLPFNFFPVLEGDLVTVQARLPYGAPIEHTQAVQCVLEKSAREAIEQHGGDRYLRGMFTRVGDLPPQRGPGGGSAETGSHLVSVEMNLVPSAERPFKADDVTEAWRELTPELPGLDSISYKAAAGPGAGAAVAVQLMHPDREILADLSEQLEQMLMSYPTLKNVYNENSAGKPQLDFELQPEARALGITSNELAMQLRSSFYGAEAIREQRGRNEVKIVARLPETERTSEHDLEQLMVRTPRGGEVPLHYVADFTRGKAPTAIRRENGQRKVTVSAELAGGTASPREVLEDLQATAFPRLREEYPQLRIELVGAQREQAETFASLGRNYLLAMFVIFALLAIPFRSYIQPVIVMTTIPFGLVGAALGHIITGYGLSIMSGMGAVALSGVVVNDSIVLIDAINEERRKGRTLSDAVVNAGAMRLRPILLTSLTTFFGLVPMISETSIQAQFLVPMAISLGFGVLFATFIVLLVVPALYVIIEDIRPTHEKVIPGTNVFADDDEPVAAPAGE